MWPIVSILFDTVMDDVILLATRICGFTTHWSWDRELYAYRVVRMGNPGTPHLINMQVSNIVSPARATPPLVSSVAIPVWSGAAWWSIHPRRGRGGQGSLGWAAAVRLEGVSSAMVSGVQGHQTHLLQVWIEGWKDRPWLATLVQARPLLLLSASFLAWIWSDHVLPLYADHMWHCGM
jgi:hypothetical protein